MENESIESTDMSQFQRRRGKSGVARKTPPTTWGQLNALVGTERSDLILEYRAHGMDVADLCFYLLKTYKSTFLAPPKKAPEVPTKN